MRPVAIVLATLLAAANASALVIAPDTPVMGRTQEQGVEFWSRGKVSGTCDGGWKVAFAKGERCMKLADLAPDLAMPRDRIKSREPALGLYGTQGYFPGKVRSLNRFSTGVYFAWDDGTPDMDLPFASLRQPLPADPAAAFAELASRPPPVKAPPAVPGTLVLAREDGKDPWSAGRVTGSCDDGWSVLTQGRERCVAMRDLTPDIPLAKERLVAGARVISQYQGLYYGAKILNVGPSEASLVWDDATTSPVPLSFLREPASDDPVAAFKAASDRAAREQAAADKAAADKAAAEQRAAAEQAAREATEKAAAAKASAEKTAALEKAAASLKPGQLGVGAKVLASWGESFFEARVTGPCASGWTVASRSDERCTTAGDVVLDQVVTKPAAGVRALALWGDGQFYGATVQSVSGGKATVSWDDGSGTQDVALAQLRVVPARLAKAPPKPKAKPASGGGKSCDDQKWACDNACKDQNGTCRNNCAYSDEGCKQACDKAYAWTGSPCTDRCADKYRACR